MTESTEAVTNTFSILVDPVRRYVLYDLDEQESPVSFDHSRLGGRTQAEPQSSSQNSEDEATTALYSCPACETTYISEEMDDCSKCGESVTQIPTERELTLSTSRT